MMIPLTLFSAREFDYHLRHRALRFDPAEFRFARVRSQVPFDGYRPQVFDDEFARRSVETPAVIFFQFSHLFFLKISEEVIK
jgi:hypothetical protein